MHTPVPWKYEFSQAEQQIPAHVWIMGGDGLSVVMQQYCGGDQDAKANAKFIVTACNAYEQMVIDKEIYETILIKQGQVIKDLVAALEMIIELGRKDTSNPKYDEYFNTAKQALLKAKGDTHVSQ